MIQKASLSLFPITGTPFEVVAGGSARGAAVESYRCECRGPDEPHKHYFIRWPALHAGDVVILEKDQRRPATYRLKVRSTSAQRELCG